jgi:hypothetical protein
MAAVWPVYHPRESTDSPLWKILHNHYEDFKAAHDEHCEKQSGFFRPVVDEVVEEFFKRGDLDEGFARVSAPVLSGGINFCETLVRRQSKSVYTFTLSEPYGYNLFLGDILLIFCTVRSQFQKYSSTDPHQKLHILPYVASGLNVPKEFGYSLRA